MITNSGMWRIENATRYNTEDLVTVFNAYEAELSKHSETQGLALRSVAEGVGVVRFRDYSPVVRSIEVTRWTPEGTASGTERVFVRRAKWGCNNEKVIGLVKPSMLYDSPLAALAHAEDGGHTPIGFSLAVIREGARDCYRGHIGADACELMPDIPVRIGARRASRPSGAPVKAEVIRKVREELSPASNAIGTMRWEMEGVRAHLKRAQTHASVISVDFSTTMDAIEDLRIRIEEVHGMMLIDHAALNRVGD